jgi:N-acetylmuramoyl-L-alanine amidase
MTGQELYDLGLPHVGEQYMFGASVPKNNKKWKGPWDCAEFASWLVYQVSGKLYGCYSSVSNPATADAYTGYWHRDAQMLGKIITLEDAARTPGAAVLRAPASGLIGHIAISDGRGGTVEAHSSKTGVIKSVISGRRWDYGVLVPGISYTKAGVVSVTPPDHIVYRYTSPMIVSMKVGTIQRALKQAGFDPKGIDNVFGTDTLNAVIAFQESKGLVVDGEVGKDTARALGITL